jgi:hypothetical protein
MFTAMTAPLLVSAPNNILHSLSDNFPEFMSMPPPTAAEMERHAAAAERALSQLGPRDEVEDMLEAVAAADAINPLTATELEEMPVATNTEEGQAEIAAPLNFGTFILDPNIVGMTNEEFLWGPA